MLRSSSLSNLCSWVEREIGYEYAVGLRNYATVIANALDEISYYADWTKNALYQHMSGRLIDAGASTLVANRVAYAVTYIIDWFVF
ncbi:hypothetical protein [Desulfitobacterium hafniense]|uniref:hypothetical protein n=1 Tax=Desulfitobacterium hafniense TaxID=49338 RepID=UPI0011D158B5|nr:hypothetical protein [Desulfitobacterium hafniense]